MTAGTWQQGETERFLTCHYRFFQSAQENKMEETWPNSYNLVLLLLVLDSSWMIQFLSRLFEYRVA